MMMREFRKDRTDLYTRSLLAAAVLLGALACLRVAGFFAASSQAQDRAVKTDPNKKDSPAPGDVASLLASSRASAEDLKKRNLFVPPVPKQHPAANVLGILGDEVLINDKWYRAGDRVGDAEILAIEPTKVRIAWDGQEKEFFPIGAEGDGSSGRTGRARPGARLGAQGGAPRVAVGSGGRAALSDEERARRREQWQKMNPEERQRAREQMRQRLGATAR